MKDFDDLWRIANSSIQVNTKELTSLLKSRQITAKIDPAWIGPDIIRIWASHQKRYQDLPEELRRVFLEINSWLSGFKL